MIKILSILFLHFSGYASMLGLYFTLYPLTDVRPNWHWFAIIVLTGLVLWLLWQEWISQNRFRRRVFRSDAEIKRYMCNWVSSPGRTAIFSRDLSWGGSPTTKTALEKKSKLSELTLCLQKPIPLSQELQSAGAVVRYYGDTGFSPRSRFTIIGYGKEGSRVAVGLTENGDHVVYEFESGKHPIFAIAEDLVNFIDETKK